MLDYLKVENFAVVEKAELQFSPQLNVLTGETGAGKSILMGAINHFLKKKTSESAIREGAEKLVVEAMFSRGDDEFILRREVNRKKSLCFINGDLVPFVKLKEKAESLFNIYGQNEHIFLLNPANHRFFLDEYGDTQPLLEELSAGYAKLKTLGGQLDELREKNEKAGERLEFINFQLSEISALKMEKGDDDVLEQRLKILSSAEEILSRSHQLVGEFYQKDHSLYNIIADNLKNLEYLKEIYPQLNGLFDEVDRFYNLLPEISSGVSDIISGVDFSQDELKEVEEKLARLHRLRTRYKMNLAQLLDRRDALQQEREQLDNMDFSIREKEEDIRRAFEVYRAVHLRLREKRLTAAEALGKLIETELRKLEMPRARFRVNLDPLEPTLENISDKGSDKIEFYFSSNPGQPLGRIRDIASGGELSRLMLVLKSILGDHEESSYIFDEIDTGIGGKTAEFVGEKLKRIAAVNQVICISHLPQIASFADAHFLVVKEFRQGSTYSSVEELDGAARVKEIGRLMAGSADSDDVLNAARLLLNKNRKN